MSGIIGDPPALGALGRTLSRLPIGLKALPDLLDPREGRSLFLRLVQELFPERRAELLAPPPPGRPPERTRLVRFASAMEERYFPIEEVESYSELLGGIPLPRMGWGTYEYHEVHLCGDGELLLRALCSHPYDTMWGEDEDVSGVRLTILELCRELVPEELLAPLVRSGLDPVVLHRHLDGTRYEGAALYADWLWQGTGSLFLDRSYEDEGDNPDWSVDAVAALAWDWWRAQEVEDRIAELERWLEGNPVGRFSELLHAALYTGWRVDATGRRGTYGSRRLRAGARRVRPRTLVEVLGASPGGARARRRAWARRVRQAP